MLFSIFLVAFVQLVLAAALLIALGRRVRLPRGRARVIPGLFSLILLLAVGFVATVAASDIWSLPAAPAEASEVVLGVLGAVVIVLRPDWNAIGQLFFASYVGAALTYLAFAADITFLGNLSVLGSLASAALGVLEFSAFVLSSSFAFETCDVLCRTRHSREFPKPDPSFVPMVSLHIAAYNEPPDMLIETLKAAEAIDYPNFEVVVIDNNTEDPAVYGPVEAYCAGRPRLRFVHVSPWPGFKSGALNLALTTHTDPRADIVGVIDADYLVDPDYLKSTVGYFADGRLAFLQTPQDYRDYGGDPYFTACYDAYRYFFAMAMPSRNERNSIIFAGTMGLLRRSALESVGGWDEWCITEDADTSLRLLRAGWEGLFISRSFGQGIMPLTFASLKSQRFRWCFGGMQILRRHWRTLMPWSHEPENHLSIGQRIDYLIGGLQWLNDLVYLGFTIVLAVVAGLLLAGEHVAIRPLVGPALLLPAALFMSGLVRAVWALRQRTRISYKRALLAFCNWLSLSWTVALACIQGLTRSEGVFLRTPKTSDEHRLWAAIWAARSETLLAIALWTAAVLLGIMASPTALLMALVAWQGTVYATAPFMSVLNQRAQLTPELERRRRSERRRERVPVAMRPVVLGGVMATVLGGLFAALMAIGASHSGQPGNPFNVPSRGGGDHGPWGGVLAPANAPPTTRPNHSTTTVTSGGTTTTSGNTGTTPAPTTTSPGTTTTVAPTTTSPSTTTSASTTTTSPTTTTAPPTTTG